MTLTLYRNCTAAYKINEGYDIYILQFEFCSYHVRISLLLKIVKKANDAISEANYLKGYIYIYVAFPYNNPVLSSFMT